jgi:hypothetical protein
MAQMKVQRGSGSTTGKGRVIPLTPVRSGRISDSGYAKTVHENLARIQARKQSGSHKG